MSGKLDSFQFSNQILSTKGNEDLYGHLSADDLTWLWLNNHPKSVEVLDPIELDRLIALHSDDNADGEVGESNTPRIDRSQYPIYDKRHWRVFPTQPGDTFIESQIKAPFNIINVRLQETVPNISNSAVQQIVHLTNNGQAIDNNFKILEKLNLQLQDPLTSDSQRNWIKTDQIPYYEDRLEAALDRKKSIEANDESSGLFGWVYNKMAPISPIVHEWHKDKLDEIQKNNPNFVRIQAWKQNDPIHTWTDYINPINYVSGMAEMSSSVIATFGPSKVLAPFKMLAKMNKLDKTAKRLQSVQTYFGAVQAPATMYLMEHSEVQQETLGYLMEEFEYEIIDPNGNIRKMQGLPFEDAIPIAVKAGFMYAGVSTWLEYWQMNRIAGYLRGGKAARKSALMTMINTIYKQTPKNKFGKLAWGGVEMFGRGLDEGYTEGWQAYASYVVTEAVRQGYNVEDPVGFAELIKDSKIPFEELGWKRATLSGVAPMFSDVQQIKEGWEAGYFGGAGTSVAGAPVDMGVSYLANKGIIELAEDSEDGDKVHIKPDGNGTGVLVYNETKDKYNHIPAGNAKEEEHILNTAINAVEDPGKAHNVTIDESIDTYDKYIDKIIQGVSTVGGLSNDMIISEDLAFWNDDANLNPVQKLFKKHQSSNKGYEADPDQKLIDIMIATKNPKIFDEAILKNRDNKVIALQLSSIKSNALKIIRKRAGTVLKKRVITGDRMDKTTAHTKIDEFVNNENKIDDDTVLRLVTEENLVERFAESINKDPVTSGNISFNPEDFKTALESGPDYKDMHDNAMAQAYQDNIDKTHKDFFANQPYIDQIEYFNTKFKVPSLDAKNATLRGLHGHVGNIYLKALEAGTDPKTAVKNAILGLEGQPAINNTNLGRLLKQLDIKHKKEALKYANAKRVFAEAIANKLFHKIEGSQFKGEGKEVAVKKLVIPRKSKLEKEVVSKEDQIEKAKVEIEDAKRVATEQVTTGYLSKKFLSTKLNISDSKAAELIKQLQDNNVISKDFTQMKGYEVLEKKIGKEALKNIKIEEKRQLKIDKLKEKFPEEEGYEIDNFTKDVGKEFKVEQAGKIVARQDDPSLPKGQKIIARVISPAVRKDGKIVKPPEYEIRIGTRELTQEEIDAQYKEDIKQWKEEVRIAKEVGAKIPPKPIKQEARKSKSLKSLIQDGFYDYNEKHVGELADKVKKDKKPVISLERLNYIKDRILVDDMVKYIDKRENVDIVDYIRSQKLSDDELRTFFAFLQAKPKNEIDLNRKVIFLELEAIREYTDDWLKTVESFSDPELENYLLNSQGKWYSLESVASQKQQAMTYGDPHHYIELLLLLEINDRNKIVEAPTEKPKDRSQEPIFVTIDGKESIMTRFSALKRFEELATQSEDDMGSAQGKANTAERLALLDALGYKKYIKGPNRVKDAIAEYKSYHPKYDPKKPIYIGEEYDIAEAEADLPKEISSFEGVEELTKEEKEETLKKSDKYLTQEDMDKMEAEEVDFDEIDLGSSNLADNMEEESDDICP